MSQKNHSASRRSDPDIVKYAGAKMRAMHAESFRYTRIVIWGFFAMIAVLFLWMGFAKIDRMTRGNGKVVTSLDIQYVQSFDGGIIRKIFVVDGQNIHRGSKLLQLDDTDFRSRYNESESEINALRARKIRLIAEATMHPFQMPKVRDPQFENRIREEKDLWDARKRTLEQKVALIREKIFQKEAEKTTIQIEIGNLEEMVRLDEKALNMSRNMLEHKLVSQLKFNEKLRQFQMAKGNLKAKRSLLPKISSELASLQNEIKHEYLFFRSRAQEELALTTSKLDRLMEAGKIDHAKIRRSLIVSPVNGVVKKMHFNTVGGVVKPGAVVAEIVPTDEHLVIDTQIAPDKIAFVYVGQKAIVRFSAYDFASYGSLPGTVISVSADTSIDPLRKKPFYTVKVKTEKSFLEKNGHHYPIKIGMMATVDIINGKQSILSYLISPLMRAGWNMQSSN